MFFILLIYISKNILTAMLSKDLVNLTAEKICSSEMFSPKLSTGYKQASNASLK